MCAHLVLRSVSATMLTVSQPQPAKAPKLPRVICRICKRLYHEPGATLQWHANAFGRSTCPHCKN